MTTYVLKMMSVMRNPRGPYSQPSEIGAHLGSLAHFDAR
jgi:hypothetical protein